MGKLMSQKEVKRAQVLDMLEEDKISQQEASKRIGVSTRQVRAVVQVLSAEGLGGLVSKKRGRPQTGGWMKPHVRRPLNSSAHTTGLRADAG